MGNKTGDIITGPLTLLLDDSPYTSTSIKDLELINLEGLSHFEDQLALARFCPDLETFIWDDTSTDDPPSVRTQYLKDLANYCPKLKSLSVHGSFEEEVHGVYSFLRARPHIPLKVLEIPHHAFGELLWQVVKENHASTLTTVDLSFSPTITGELSHEIMCALPNLESLKVPTIKDRDLVRDRRPWICHRLQHLTIGFQFVVESRTLFSPLSSSSSSSLPEKDNRKMVFERLGTLRFLKTLNIRELDYDVQPLGGLRFQLKDGLDFLKTLQQLEELELWNGNQELSKTDVQWMVDHWPRLRILFGKLHSSKVSSTAYTRLLLAHGIKPWASIPKAVYIS
ncbi:hypothetical protein BGZ83_002162 [Gryganskiella cystojenkinii]|nr:hypothetical protein BGZ83_002162 [Gryganskiella cystojenkinii]